MVEPSSGEIAEGTSDHNHVSSSRWWRPILIDVGDQPPPFVSEPKLDGTFLLGKARRKASSPSAASSPGASSVDSRFRPEGREGKPFAVKDWSAEFTTPKFAITSDFGEREELGARPQIYLESTYAVQLAEAAEHIYFQERDSHERFPVEVIANDRGEERGPTGSDRVQSRAARATSRRAHVRFDREWLTRCEKPPSASLFASDPSRKNRAAEGRMGRRVQSRSRGAVDSDQVQR